MQAIAGVAWVVLAVALALGGPGGARAAADGPEPLRVVIVGDSTVCDYPMTSPCRGWGQFIGEHFRDGAVRVVNCARSGRSTKTFVREGLWLKALAGKPDVVLIQFGHNDSHGPGKPESTDAATDYRDYLRQYIDDSRAAGAAPILVTPMHRRVFDSSGRLADILQPYADAMKAVAAETGAPVIDLHAASGARFAALGPEGSAAFNSAPGDRTHFNADGARAMADLVLAALPGAEPRLGALLAAARFEIAGEEPGTLTLTNEGARAVFVIRGGRGIGRATIRRLSGVWPGDVVLRAGLGGLEHLALSAGRVRLAASVSSHGDHARRLECRADGHERPPPTPGSPWWMEIRALDAEGLPTAGLPPPGGWFEMRLPPALLSGAETLELEWIDFYR